MVEKGYELVRWGDALLWEVMAILPYLMATDRQEREVNAARAGRHMAKILKDFEAKAKKAGLDVIEEEEQVKP